MTELARKNSRPAAYNRSVFVPQMLDTGITPFLREAVCTSWSKRTSVTLACPEGQRIEIDNAFYGFWKGDKRRCGFNEGDCKDFTAKPSKTVQQAQSRAGRRSVVAVF